LTPADDSSSAKGQRVRHFGEILGVQESGAPTSKSKTPGDEKKEEASENSDLPVMTWAFRISPIGLAA
jgi:hypothetical protein